MTLIATEGKYIADVVKAEYPGPEYTRDVITIVSGAGAIQIGHVLGKITTGGKYKPATATGSDGAQLASAIALEAVDATSGDKLCIALVRGHSIVSQNDLTWGATIDDATKRAAAKVQLLANAGILAKQTA